MDEVLTIKTVHPDDPKKSVIERTAPQPDKVEEITIEQLEGMNDHSRSVIANYQEGIDKENEKIVERERLITEAGKL